MTKNELVGDFFNATIKTYFGLNDLQEKAQTSLSNVVAYRLPSFGIFSTVLRTSFWFGLPRNVTVSSLVLDVDRIAIQAVSKDGSKSNRVNFIRSSGVRSSAMEHHVPEVMFSFEGNTAQAISAVKALAIASQDGQRIWTITKDNLQIALSAINLDTDIENEIRNSVAAGNEVTAHENPVSFAGSSVTGYILFDPNTGAGAYKISGGNNGGEAFLGIALGLLQAFAFFLIATPFLAAIATAAILISSLIVAFSGSFNSTQQLDFNGGRLLGLIGGFILTWILGGFVFVSIPFFFMVGLAILVFTVFRLLLVEFLSVLARNMQKNSNLRFAKRYKYLWRKMTSKRSREKSKALDLVLKA